MKSRALSKWSITTKTKGLLYFAQILEEMLFDYSLPTYKFSIMHTGSLCSEAITVLDEIHKGNIRAPNINHVAAELAYNLERDEVALSLLSLNVGSFTPVLKNPKSKPNDIRTIVELLSVQLSPLNYKRRNEELLIDEIENSQDFASIRRLARSYLTTLISLGFHQKHLENTVLDFFYHSGNSITDPDSIRDFIEIVNMEPRNFKVIFKTMAIFREVKEASDQLDVTISDDFPSEINLSNLNIFNINTRNETYAITEVKAKDYFSAREMGEHRLKTLITLLTLYHHKKQPTWSKDCIVYSIDEDKYKKISCPTNPMEKCVDLELKFASNKLKLFLDNFGLEKNSFAKFNRSAQLHSLALRSDSQENQILNLWISIESLIPSENREEDISNIEHIIDSLVPFLNINYVEDLSKNLVKDLLRWNLKVTRRALKHVQGRKFTDRLVKLLILSEYSGNLAIIENNLGNFHLLASRVKYLQDALSSPSKVLAILNAHKTRLEWQLRRIYRVRNIIVHSGITPAYTKLVIPHVHDYLDTVLNALALLASEPKVIHSVTQGFKYTQLEYKSYIEKLSEKGLTFTKENTEKLLFPRLK